MIGREGMKELEQKAEGKVAHPKITLGKGIAGGSFCANSELFTHGLLGEPRNLSKRAIKEREQFFKDN